ncbi:Hsp20/alpha crystallin family protein [Paenibacillus sp. TH7-28]
MRNKGGLTSWEEFEKQMLEQFPFLPKNFTQGNPARNFSWVGDFVQKQLQKSMPADFNIPIFNNKTANYDLYETHRNLIVRLPVSEDFSLDQTKVSVNRNKLRIVLPSGEKREIQLKKQVNPKQARAKYKEGILEIQMPKLPEHQNFHDVFVESENEE